MPAEENDLDEAYARFSKRLKAKAAESDPTKDATLRGHLEEIDKKTPEKSQLFADAELRLKRLKDEFQIEIQTPQTLQEHIIFLLSQGQIATPPGTPVTMADLYSEIHEVDKFRTLSNKEIRKTLKQLEKADVVHLSEIQGTHIVRLHNEFMSDDEAAILDIAARKAGKVSVEQIMLSTQWPQARVQIALDLLVAKKLVILKRSFTRGTRYQVPEKP